MSARELQIAVYNALSADAPLVALVQGIYDNVTQVSDPGDNSAFPFLTIGDGLQREWDTNTELGHEAEFRIHVWSRAHHSLEAKQIADAVISVLHHGTLTISGASFIGCDYVTQNMDVRDPDGVTRHGVIEFRIVYDEV